MRGSLILRGALIGFVAAAVLGGPAWAQNRDKAWEVTPELGWVFYGNPNLGNGTTDTTFTSGSTTTRQVTTVTSDAQDSLSYGFRFAYHMTKKHMIEFGFGGSSTTGTFFVHKTTYDVTTPPGTLTSDEHKQEDVSMDQIVIHSNYIYNMFLQHRGKVVAFATAGIGLVNSSIFGQTADPDLAGTLNSLVGDENSWMYDYGAGIRFFGGEKTAFRIEARQFRYNSTTRGSQEFIEVNLGLSFVLGGA
jgi:hypothetical protein